MNKWWRDIGSTRAIIIVVSAFVIALITIAIVWMMPVGNLSYSEISIVTNKIPTKPIPPPITHIRTPESVKAVYITACTASGKKYREKVLDVIAGTEINAMIIDIKDYSGTLAYASTSVRSKNLIAATVEGASEALLPNYGGGCRIIDLPQFVRQLHEKGIYAIARITVFQ